MKVSLLTTLLAATLALASDKTNGKKPKPVPSCPPPPAGECHMPAPIPVYNGTTDFLNIGMILFPAYDLIDVYGTLEALSILSIGKQRLNLYLIAETLDPVTAAVSPGMNRHQSEFGPKLLPNTTFETHTAPLDILFVPGGPGTRNPNTTNIENFVKAQVPKVKIFATVCTGATIAARAGVFDGRVATTNKAAWNTITKDGPNVHWVAPARYVRDGKFWSASGVTSGIDMVDALIRSYWGEEQADRIARIIEHVPVPFDDDPFAAANNVTGAAKLCPEYKG